MSALRAVSDDVLGLICNMIGMRDLVALSTAMTLPDWVWTIPVRRRCGERWPAGVAGMRRLYQAVYGTVPLPLEAFRSVRSSAMASYAAGPGGRNVWATLPHRTERNHRQSVLDRSVLDRSVTCLAAIDEETVAVGHAYGVYLYKAHVMNPVWLGVAVCDVAYVSGGRLWICTLNHSTFEYCTRTENLTAVHVHGFCVSGPIPILGSSRGTWPLIGSINVPCTRIVQSDVQIAAWYISGHIVVFDAITQLQMYLMDTGGSLGTPAFSIIGDIIRINRKTWSGGRCTGRCPDDTREVTSDGRCLYVSNYGKLGVSVYT